jgi:signal transduction histidine kinase
MALVIVVSASIVGVAGAAFNAPSPITFVNEAAWAALPALFVGLGVLIEVRQPGNRVGWLLMAIAGGQALSGLMDFAVNRIDSAPESLTVSLFLLLWAENSNWAAFVFPTFLLLYVFPTGRLLSRRWVWVPVSMMVMIGILLLSFIAQTEVGPFDQSWLLANPIGFLEADTINIILAPWAVALMILAVGGVVAVVMRFRRAAVIERAQIKLVLVSVVFFAVSYGVLLLSESFTDPSSPIALLLPIGFGGIPVAIAMAVLKHGLFEIDVVISRSLTFGALAVFIGGVYVGIVVGVGALLDQDGGSSAGLSIVATSVVALGFQPVRVRVEGWASRLVYGKRATPYEVLARFSHRAAEESDEDVLARIPRLIVDGTGAIEAALWVRTHDGFRAVSVWPEDVSARTMDDGGVFEDPEGDLSLPVVHDGELLGGISLVAARGGTITPPEGELLAKLADGLGLTLRNSQLTSQLRRQVKDLRRSRDRVLLAADEARRSLEHDLDSGPQQQLVAVKVKLGPLRKLAEQAGAARTAEILADIEAQASDAILAVRDFAAGIYPPLLGAEGLAVALGQEVHKAALPVELEVDGVGRYPRDVEAAVYFSILEALQNTAKYAEASRALVRLSQRNGVLRFDVSDDGRGFDPATITHGVGLNGIADRLDTIGGTWAITSTPGNGTTITGTVPVEAPVDI